MTLNTMRRLGAITLLIVGAVHLQQYIGGDYSVLPTIGPLFLLNAIGAAVVAIGLLAPVERMLRHRHADLTAGLLAVAALAIAVGSLVALFIAESQPLFGFMESGYDLPILIAIVAEALTALLLAPVAVRNLQGAASGEGPSRSRRALNS
ncbi:MAG: hypothetical protein ACJ780_17080 [Solirubrobacteraceae bacterium]